MSGKIKLTPSELKASSMRFKSCSQEVDNILRSCDDSVNMLVEFWEGVSTQRFIEEYRNMRRTLDVFPRDILKFANQLNYTAKTMHKQDAKLGNSVKKVEEKTKTESNAFDKVIGSAAFSGAVSVSDKYVGIKLNEMYPDGYIHMPITGNRAFRRSNLPKDFAIELPKGLRLAKGFGILSTAYLGVSTGYEDIKNNNSWDTRAEAIGVDGVSTVVTYGATEVGTDVVIGLAAGILGVEALPVVGTVAIAVGVAGAAGYLCNKGANWFKGLVGLK